MITASTVEEFIEKRDAWIFSMSDTLAYKTISREVKLSPSRIKAIIYQQRKLKEQLP